MTESARYRDRREAPAGGHRTPAGRAASMRAAHFCHSCGKVQPPVPVDYFTFFGLPPQAQSRHRGAGKRFLRAEPQAASRLNAGRPTARSRIGACEQSSMLNDAYRTLKDPIKRTQYLLHLEGVELEEQSKTRDRKGARHGRTEEADRAAGFAGRSLRTEHASRRTAHEKKMGDDDPALFEEIGKAKLSLEAKYEALLQRTARPTGSRWDSR